MTSILKIAGFLDSHLNTADIPDYSPALNGLQLENSSPITKVATAVDFSSATIEKTIAAGANLLIVHHGMFWSGTGPITEANYKRLKSLLDADVAVYSSHIPLDCHPKYGNNVLLAKELGLQPNGKFGAYKEIFIGVSGGPNGYRDNDHATGDGIKTAELFKRVQAYSQSYGGVAVSTPIKENSITRNWAICSGSGASSETLKEAHEKEIDTLIVGEGPHHTAVEAAELGITILYAGHYATETLGVQKLGSLITEEFGIESFFVHVPTSL